MQDRKMNTFYFKRSENHLLKIFILIVMTFQLNAIDTKEEQSMNKIIISKHNESHNVPWVVRNVVEILIKENVPLAKINQDALESYWFTKSLHDFRYGGYANFLYQIKNDKHKKQTIFKLLKQIGATEHLSYMTKQEKVFQSLSSKEKKEFEIAEYLGYIDKNIYKKVKGSGYKEITKKENLSKLHTLWLKSLDSFEVASFTEKYAYLSKIVGKNIMPIDEKVKETYSFLIEWNEKKSPFNLMYFADIEVWGEIEKFYWREWASDAKGIDSIADEFYSFGVDGSGGHFLLWYYADMKKEPAIVYFSSEGEKVYLASSFDEYVCMLPSTYGERDLKTYLSLLEQRPLQKNIEKELYDFFEEYEEKNNLDLTTSKMATLLIKEITMYQKLVCKNANYDKNNSQKVEEKKRFNNLSKQLDGEPLSTLDYIKAYVEIYKRLTR